VNEIPFGNRDLLLTTELLNPSTAHKRASSQHRNLNSVLKSKNKALIAVTAGTTGEILIRLKSITKKAITIPLRSTAITKLHKLHTEEDLKRLLMLRQVQTGEVSKNLSQKNGGVKRMTLVMIRTFTSTKKKHRSTKKKFMKVITIENVIQLGSRRLSNLKSESSARLSRVLNALLSQKWSARLNLTSRNRLIRCTQKNQHILNRAIRFTPNKAILSTINKQRL